MIDPHPLSSVTMEMGGKEQKQQKRHQHRHSGPLTIILYPLGLAFSHHGVGGKEQKRHQHRHSGPKAEKKKNRKQEDVPEESDARKRNPKAFAVQSAVRMKKTFHR